MPTPDTRPGPLLCHTPVLLAGFQAQHSTSQPPYHLDGAGMSTGYAEGGVSGCQTGPPITTPYDDGQYRGYTSGFQPHQTYRGRPDGPPPSKLPAYDGKRDWRPYAIQFDRIATRYQWPNEERIDRFLGALQDKALKYFTELPPTVQDSWPLITEKMNRRFGHSAESITIRRDLQELQQKEAWRSSPRGHTS